MSASVLEKNPEALEVLMLIHFFQMTSLRLAKLQGNSDILASS